MTQAFNLSQLANNLNTSGQLDATDGLTGAVPVANGGTGQSSLSANAVLLGNGTGGVQTVAPSTSGNVLVSNGTTWVSQAPSGGGVTSLNGQTGAVVTTDLGAIGCTMVLMNATSSDLGANGTRAGSGLRYGYVQNDSQGGYSYVSGANGQTQACSRFSGRTTSPGGTALSGTWRKLCSSTVYTLLVYSKGNFAYYFNGLYVRIS